MVALFFYSNADKWVLTKLKMILGGRLRFLPAAGAHLDDKVISFFLAVGINIKYQIWLWYDRNLRNNFLLGRE